MKISPKLIVYKVQSLHVNPNVIASTRLRGLSKRYPTLNCVSCTMQPTHVVKYRQKGEPESTRHRDAFGVDCNNDAVMFTVDHILPKSAGGKNTTSNYQVMCQPCNSKRGHITSHQLITTIIENVDNYLRNSQRAAGELYQYLNKYHPWVLFDAELLNKLIPAFIDRGFTQYALMPVENDAELLV